MFRKSKRAFHMVSKIVLNMDMKNYDKKINMMKTQYVRVLCEFCHGSLHRFCTGDNGTDGPQGPGLGIV